MNNHPEWQIKVKWDNDEVTWEPIYVMSKDDLLSLVEYTHKHKLTNTNGCKYEKKSKKPITKYVS